MEKEDGVWRTISGRRIFIKNGQSLSDAMQQSGKFNNLQKRLNERINKGLSATDVKFTYNDHPKPKLIANIDIKDKKLVEKTLKYYESKIKNDIIENAIVITRDGDIYHCIGNENSVWPDIDLGSKLYGAIITHNHPQKHTDYGFSSNDIKLFEQFNIKILRGIDNKYTYELSNLKKSNIEYPTFSSKDISINHIKSITYSKEKDIYYMRWKNE